MSEKKLPPLAESMPPFLVYLGFSGPSGDCTLSIGSLGLPLVDQGQAEDLFTAANLARILFSNFLRGKRAIEADHPFVQEARREALAHLADLKERGIANEVRDVV